MKQEVKKTAEMIKKGGIILYPTDTIWGIGCDATNWKAVERIYKLKNRQDSKSMLVLVSSVKMLEKYVNHIPEQAYQLIQFATKPLTIIYPDGVNLAENLLAADYSIGIRLTKDPFCANLINEIRRPLVSTSANVSGQASPKNFAEITQTIKDGVDYIVGLRQNKKTNPPPSNIIKLELNGQFQIIR